MCKRGVGRWWAQVEMLLEASWGGSLKQLDKKEESFIAIAFRHAWTPALYVKTFIRRDNQPLYENEKELSGAPTLLMGVGLDYHWDTK